MSNAVDLKIFHPYKVDGLKRIGNKNDGGYIVHLPSLQQVDCLLNYGVGYNVAFEKEFHKLTNAPVYAFDPTMKKLKYFVAGIKQGEYFITAKQVVKLMLWLAQENSLEKHGIHFIEEGLSDKNTEDFKTLDYHLLKYNLRDKNIFLKIDIEGAEYDIIRHESFYNNLKNVMQLIFEFHFLDKRLPEISDLISKLEPTHSLVHIHGNNNGGTFSYNGKNVPDIVEAVFLHNSFLPVKKLSSADYPVEGLDYPCNWRRKDIPLNFFK